MDPEPFDLSKTYVHLGLGATVVPLRDFGWDGESLARYAADREERDGAEVQIRMGPGDAVVNPRGTWHTVDVQEPGRALYVTAGRGTLHRTR